MAASDVALGVPIFTGAVLWALSSLLLPGL
jgi:hypothetical protein